MARSEDKRIPDVMVINPEKCKFCSSRKIVRYGYYRGVQRWWCKDCLRKFVHNDALPGMRTPVVQVASALDMFYEGMSLTDIKKHLERQYRTYLSNSTIYEWVLQFTRIAIEATYHYRPEVGDIWVADEEAMKVEGANLWFLDLFDSSSQFWLAHHLCTNHTAGDARTLVERAARRTDKAPKVIIADKLRGYLDGIEVAFTTDTKHPSTIKLPSRPCPQLIKRFRGTLKACIEITGRLKTRHSAELITCGWLVHYNFFRPNITLDATPAEKAGIKSPFRNWLDIVRGEMIST